MISAIATVPPYAPFLKEVARHPIVSGLRLNTVMPAKEPLEDLLKRLQDVAEAKPVWIDLKGRQLRTTGYATPPFTEVTVSHAISVKTPAIAYFGNGRETATLAAVDGKRLIFLDGPRRVVGPGESINIVEPSLVIYGGLTDTDKAYIDAGCKTGNHKYMLSYVECEADISELLKHDPAATIVAKIESQKGMKYVKERYDGSIRLMAARGDLYVEVEKPHHVLTALQKIVDSDKDAIAASRIYSSLANSTEPECADLFDAWCLLLMGYKTLMLGDEICLKRPSIISALNLFEATVESFREVRV